MVGTEFDVPRDGWRNAGFAIGPEALCEWATLDAQFFNVAQRRVRVFALADFGNWSNRPPILLERDSLRGDSAPRREAGEGATGIAGGGPDGGRLSGTVSSKWAKGTGGPAGDECCSLIAHTLRGQAQSSHRADSETYVAHTRRGEGFDASEDGTGRGTPIVPVAFMADDYKGGGYEECDTARPLATSADRTRAAPIAAHRTAVRRLTPRECERLQGFPDDWTAIPWREKPAEQCPGGPRYTAIGNSMAVPVMLWIGQQIKGVI
jgi:DNA (cytosine-5)-methyltransferase 1